MFKGVWVAKSQSRRLCSRLQSGFECFWKAFCKTTSLVRARLGPLLTLILLLLLLRTLARVLSHPRPHAGLLSILIMPVQRMMRYILLLGISAQPQRYPEPTFTLN